MTLLLLISAMLLSPVVMLQFPCDIRDSFCQNQRDLDFPQLFESITAAEEEGLKVVEEKYGEEERERLFGTLQENVWTADMSSGPRHKRAITSDINKYWPNAIVPYSFDDDVSEWSRKESLIAMRRHEKYSCIRFVPWVANKTIWEWNLPDEAHMRLVKADGCWAFLGNNHSPNGQKISCCSRSNCIHELSHILGVYHGQTSPAHKGWISINWNNIAPNNWNMYGVMDADAVHVFRYDLSSNMHYNSVGFRAGPWPVMSVLFQDLAPLIDIGGNTFYLWQEIAETNQCKERLCPDFKLECVNDGYPSYVDGECRCLCPPGLDYRTGCSTVIKKVESASSWPSGSFGLFSASDECPPGLSPFTFETETILYETSSNFHLGGNITDEFVDLLLCMRVPSTAKENFDWQPGIYCLLASVEAECPPDFERHIDDLPEFNLTFCCRDDGYRDDPLNLPLETPFILLPNNVNGPCQSVAGMLATVESLEMSIARSDLKLPDGLPLRIFGNNHLTLGFCYYTKYIPDCGEEIHLSKSKTSEVFTSPGYPGNYTSPLDCYWLIKGPPNSTIVLDFDDFEIGEDTTSCDEDFVKVRYALLGQITQKHCGWKLNKSFRSIENVMTLNLHTDLVDNYKGFKATARVILPESHCYDLEDRGSSYRGKVNYTRDYKPCLPWDRVTSCSNHLFNPSDFDDMLEENYCRNPDNSFRPWCYTNTYEGQCDRNYCDVCRLEKVYDVASDCTQLKEEGFCKRDSKEILPLCAKTCEVKLPQTKVTSSCGRPPVLPDALLTFDRRWHDVGDTVTHKCPFGPETITRRCHSDGTWSPGNYVCGACSKDWSPHNGACYMYIPRRLTYSQAVDFCALRNSFLSTAKSTMELTFISSLRPKLKKIWLGATRKKEKTTWVNIDESRLDLGTWIKGTGVTDDQTSICAFILPENKDNAFGEDSCLSTHTFVCKRVPTPRRGCVNRRWDCHSVLRRNPKMCQDFPDFAWQQCPFTCGVCQPYRTPFCTVLPHDETVDVVGDRIQYLPRGHVISYECRSGMVLREGDLHRVCEDSGWLSGKPPICIDMYDIITPNNQVPLVKRLNTASVETSYVGNNSLHRIHRDGEIVRWSFYARSHGTACLQVWRPRPDVGPLEFEFIGQNFVTALANRVNKVDIPIDGRIQVLMGDVIGVYSGTPASPIVFNDCGGQVTPEADYSVVLKKASASYFEMTKVYTFKNPGCRTFSLTAHVNSTWHPYTFTSMVPLEAAKHTVSQRGNMGYVMPNSFLTIRVNGLLVEWRTYLQTNGVIAFQVWRPRPEEDNLAFELVGQTKKTFEKDGIQTIHLNGSEQIRVKKDDVIGIWFGEPPAIVSFKSCNPTDIPHEDPLIFMQTEFNFTVGAVTTFTTQFLTCRVYPLIAILEQGT